MNLSVSYKYLYAFVLSSINLIQKTKLNFNIAANNKKKKEKNF